MTAHTPPPTTAATTARTTATPATTGASPRHVRGRIWYVDDSKVQLERATRALAGAHDVETFPDGALLLEKLAAGEPPDVVMLDWQMPGLSGLDVCRFLREQYDEVTLPILMLTARSERRDFNEGLAAGANDYVVIPYDDAELVARLRTLVRIRRQAEETRDRELWLRTTLSSIGEGVIATDAAGCVVFMNPIAEELTGVDQNAALGRPFVSVCRIVDEPGGAQVISRAGRVRDGAVDQRIAIEHVASPIQAQGKTVGTVYVLRDVTKRVQDEREARARHDFEEKLIGIVSHDLRNPLQAILLGTGALLSQADIDERTAKSVFRIQRCAKRATNLVNDVLDFTQARLGSGIPLQRQNVNVHELAAQAADEVLAAHPQSDILVERAGDGAGFWDPDRLAQVLSNLLSNAFKYGAPDKPVTLRTRGDVDVDVGVVIIDVHNDGEPITPAIMSTMFEPMKRGSESGDVTMRSVGLGLYIVKHIVDAHRGAIEVRSSLDEGTTFSVRLPRL